MTRRYVSRDLNPLRALTDAVSARIGAALNHPGTPASVVSIAEWKAGYGGRQRFGRWQHPQSVDLIDGPGIDALAAV